MSPDLVLNMSSEWVLSQSWMWVLIQSWIWVLNQSWTSPECESWVSPDPVLNQSWIQVLSQSWVWVLSQSWWVVLGTVSSPQEYDTPGLNIWLVLQPKLSSGSPQKWSETSRTRLTNKNLTALAEVKIHIRNEYLKPEKKSWLKRQFRHSPDKPTAAVPTHPAPHPVHPGPPHFASRSTSHSIPVGPSQPCTQLESTQPETNGVNNHSNFRAFRDIVDQHALAVNEDNEDNEPVCVSNAASPWIQTPLSTLFDFTSSQWKERHEKWARLSYDEELALYELLKLDADSEVDPDFDRTVEDILANWYR